MINHYHWSTAAISLYLALRKLLLLFSNTESSFTLRLQNRGMRDMRVETRRAKTPGIASKPYLRHVTLTKDYRGFPRVTACNLASMDTSLGAWSRISVICLIGRCHLPSITRVFLGLRPVTWCLWILHWELGAVSALSV